MSPERAAALYKRSMYKGAAHTGLIGWSLVQPRPCSLGYELKVSPSGLLTERLKTNIHMTHFLSAELQTPSAALNNQSRPLKILSADLDILSAVWDIRRIGRDIHSLHFGPTRRASCVSRGGLKARPLAHSPGCKAWVAPTPIQ